MERLEVKNKETLLAPTGITQNGYNENGKTQNIIFLAPADIPQNRITYKSNTANDKTKNGKTLNGKTQKYI